jgi:hypothetical protein
VRFTLEEETHNTIVRAVVRAPQELGAEDVGKLEARLQKPTNGTRLALRLLQIHTTVMTRNGPLFSSEDADGDDR